MLRGKLKADLTKDLIIEEEKIVASAEKGKIVMKWKKIRIIDPLIQFKEKNKIKGQIVIIIITEIIIKMSINREKILFTIE